MKEQKEGTGEKQQPKSQAEGNLNLLDNKKQFKVCTSKHFPTSSQIADRLAVALFFGSEF